ncbi:MAG: tetratricopeptide repeat protein [Aggregatilineales bacterium]
MTDAMPDFDNMTQEQINEWMESLARRQGATEGFTTAASMAVPEIDPSSVDQSLLEDNYVPYGWSREDWNAYLQKEEAQKRNRTASPPPPAAAAPPPPPAPAPAPAAGRMMSEQELTEYILSLDLEQQMELLAEMGKSQRGEPNRLAELLPAWDTSTVDESKLGEYTPGYMSEEEWKAYQAKEAAAKAAAAPPPPPISEPVADLGDVLKPPSLEDLLTPAAPTPSVADLFNQQEATLDELEPLDTGALSGLFANQTSYEPSDIPPVPAASAALDDPIQWLSQLGGAAPEAAALPSVSFEELNKNLVDLPQPVVDDDPLTWLSSLSELQPSTPEPIEDLDTGVFNLRNLSALAESVAAGGADASDEISWLESIARASGADQAELVTAADVPLPPPVGINVDGPGYQPYSFESAYPSDEPAAALDDEASSEVIVPDVSSFDDPESWLDALAAGVNAQREEAVELKAEAAPPVVIPEDPMEVMRALNAGAEVPPEAVESFFEKMFERAEQMPDEPAVTDGDLPPIEAEIPDWLQESFASIDQDNLSDIPVAQMLEDLGLTEQEFNATSPLIDPQYAAPTPLDWQVEIHDAPDPVELDFNALVGIEDEAAPELTAAAIPAWILEQTGDLSGDMMDDIFADDENTVPIELEQRPLVVDTSDPWVQAFAKESSSPQELEAWYNSRVAQIGDGPPPARVEPAAALEQAAPVIGGLQAAQLPAETVLDHATPVTVPTWLVDDAVVAAPEPAAAPEWFEADEEPIPSWLQSQVAEELTPNDPLPDWLAGADVAGTEVPSWLLETVEEQPKSTPEPAVVIPPPPPVKPAPSVVIERTAPPAPAPARPAPAAAPPAEVAAHLEQARQQITSNVEVSLQHYEAVVRANAALNEVVQDLSRAVNDKSLKTNPAVYRVLGDALMRQGKLQDALSTYRKALNLLG